MAKLSQSQVYRPIFLNLLQQKKVRKIRRLYCTSQMSSGLFTPMLSCCKITMPRMVCINLTPAMIAFLDCYYFFSQVLSSLGLTIFLETQSAFTWIKTLLKRALILLHGSPSPRNELKKLFRSGSTKSRKHMVHIIYMEKFHFDFFYIGANAKYSAVGKFSRFCKTMMYHLTTMT